MTRISGWVKCCQSGGFRKAGSDNPGAGRRLRSGSIRLTITRGRITQRSAGKLPPVKNKKLAKKIYRKMQDGICPLENWRTEHSWSHGPAVTSGKIGKLRFVFSLFILGSDSAITSNQINRTISSNILICTCINLTARCHTSYTTYTVSVLCSVFATVNIKKRFFSYFPSEPMQSICLLYTLSFLKYDKNNQHRAYVERSHAFCRLS